MAKKVKLKQKDIQEIVLDIMKEQINDIDKMDSGEEGVYQLVQNPETGEYFMLNIKNTNDIISLSKG